MNIAKTFDRLHSLAKANSWLWLFSVFCRFALAAGFFPAGIVKLTGERFASGLSVNHPMGHYLEALSHTGFYYTFIGVVQVLAAVMLIVPRTVTLGAFLYLPVILNICILTYAVRFDGSLFTAPLMTLANLFLLGWNYEKWKYILPFNRLPDDDAAAARRENYESAAQTEEGASLLSDVFSRHAPRLLFERLRGFLKRLFSDKFPLLFFAGVFAAVVVCVAGIPGLYHIKPRNTPAQCIRQFKDTNRTEAGQIFCDCVHVSGAPLDKCMSEFFSAPEDSDQTL